jgi:P27 family predicted phage terminase small subunit
MAVGRPPKPTHIRALAGNPGKRPLNENEPKPEKGIPGCPEWLQDYAREYYEELSPKLDAMGVLTTADRDALVALAISLANMRYGYEQTRKVGFIMKTPSGYVQTNPFVGLTNHAIKQARAMMQEFGMTPSARTRITVADAESESDPFDDFLNRRKA